MKSVPIVIRKGTTTLVQRIETVEYRFFFLRDLGKKIIERTLKSGSQRRCGLCAIQKWSCKRGLILSSFDICYRHVRIFINLPWIIVLIKDAIVLFETISSSLRDAIFIWWHFEDFFLFLHYSVPNNYYEIKTSTLMI